MCTMVSSSLLIGRGSEMCTRLSESLQIGWGFGVVEGLLKKERMDPCLAGFLEGEDSLVSEISDGIRFLLLRGGCSVAGEALASAAKIA